MKNILWALTCLYTISLTAQEDENIGTQTVTVVKPYSPTVADAFKINADPTLNDSIVLQKKEIEYNIFSVPVASTFTPAKGQAAKVEKLPPPSLYNTYASLGLGNYSSALVDLYTNRSFNRGQDLVNLGLKHHSARGNIEGNPLDNLFYNTELLGGYAKKDREYAWGADMRFKHGMYNWYGIPEGVYDETTINGIDERQNYFTIEAGAHINMEDEYVFQDGNVQLRRFWDAAQSVENRASFSLMAEFPITEAMFSLRLHGDYVGGSFENASLNEVENLEGIKYGLVQVGVIPSLEFLQDDLTLNLGANLMYGLDTQNNGGSFYIYPAVTASYRLMEDNVIAYGGIEGTLKQNSYYDFVEKNPYVSPTLEIQPTDQQYDAYVGLKGQLLPSVGYNVKGSYSAENYKPLFMLNPQNAFRNDEKGYYYGNSFQVFYDDVKTLGFFGELNIDVNRNFSMAINAEVYEYDTETDNPAWNLPNLRAALSLDYQIGEKWFMGANLFYVDKRSDISRVAQQNTLPNDFPATRIDLDSFFDANAHLGYRVNDQWSVFIKGANLGGTNYQQWAQFPVQGLQVLAGASYKFDL